MSEKPSFEHVPAAPGSREPSPTVSALTGFDPSREDWHHCDSPYAPLALRQADIWSTMMRTGKEGRLQAAQEIEASVEAFKLEYEPENTDPYTFERLIWQARVHSFNYAMRELKVTDPLFGEGAPFGLPWGLIAGRSRLDAIACFRLAQGMSTRSAETEGLSPKDASPVRDSECAQGYDILEWRS